MVQISPCKHKEVTLTLPCILEGVNIPPRILGCVAKMRYAYHDITDKDKYPEFAPQVYMERKGTSPLGVPILDPKQWIAGMYNTCIMNLLEIPHFGRDKYVIVCVK
jgi:hypothetical protein